MDDSTAHAFGRVEAKLDRIDDRLNALGQRVAEHGVRLSHVEGRVDALDQARNTDTRHGISLRGSILAGLTTVAASGLVTTVVNLFVK